MKKLIMLIVVLFLATAFSGCSTPEKVVETTEWDEWDARTTSWDEVVTENILTETILTEEILTEEILTEEILTDEITVKEIGP